MCSVSLVAEADPRDCDQTVRTLRQSMYASTILVLNSLQITISSILRVSYIQTYQHTYNHTYSIYIHTHIQQVHTRPFRYPHRPSVYPPNELPSHVLPMAIKMPLPGDRQWRRLATAGAIRKIYTVATSAACPLSSLRGFATTCLQGNKPSHHQPINSPQDKEPFEPFEPSSSTHPALVSPLVEAPFARLTKFYPRSPPLEGGERRRAGGELGTRSRSVFGFAHQCARLRRISGRPEELLLACQACTQRGKTFSPATDDFQRQGRR
jgi:hypothetical protein